MLPRIALCLVLALCACSTPQERCINGVTRDLRVVNNLLQETEGNLARGYRMREYTITRTVWVPCYPPVLVVQPDGTRRYERSGQMCLDDRDEVVRRPEAIDPVSERNKLAGLKDRQRNLARQAEPAIAQCRLIHPE